MWGCSSKCVGQLSSPAPADAPTPTLHTHSCPRLPSQQPSGVWETLPKVPCLWLLPHTPPKRGKSLEASCVLIAKACMWFTVMLLPLCSCSGKQMAQDTEGLAGRLGAACFSWRSRFHCFRLSPEEVLGALWLPSHVLCQRNGLWPYPWLSDSTTASHMECLKWRA